MKVLFLSVTAGQGHNQTAKAAMEYLKEKNIECTMLDAFSYINTILSISISKGYLMSTKFTPAVYGRLYRLAEKLEHNNIKMSISRLTNSLFAKKLTSYIRDYNPDVIVCTHIFAAQILTRIKRKGLSAKTIGIITDYTIHPFWEETDLDYYITPCESLNYQVERKGIPLEKVKPFGIPIHNKFSRKMPPEEARKILGIENKDTILVMSGSMGYGKFINVIKKLDKLNLDFQIVSVCGNNKSLKKKIDLYNPTKRIYNFGFVDNVDVIMDASNLIITKPGGLTISESLAKHLPMILVNPIPGQEDRNVEFLLNNGLGIFVTKTYPIDEAIYQLVNNGEMLDSIHKRLVKMAKPNSTKDLCDFIMGL